MSAVIEATGLRKSFGRVTALDGLDLSVEHGQVTAVLGPNGAGKTTFVRAVATLVRPDRGTLRVAGIDALAHPARVRRAIGLAGQHATVDAALTGRENLEMVARLFGRSRRDARTAATAVLDRLRLTADADRPVRTYSGGMRRRLDLAASLAGAPRLLLLDEPTAGLDPRGRIDLWDSIRALAADGTDVLLTTQYLDEADRLADRIVIIDRGRVIASGTARELKGRAGRDVVEVHVRGRGEVGAAAAALGRLGPGDVHVDEAALVVSAPVDNGPERLMAAVQALTELSVEVEDVALRRPTLDEVFLALTATATPAGDGTGSGRSPVSANGGAS